MMTDATAAALEPMPAEYVQIWADSFSQVLAEITSAPLPCLVQRESPAELPPLGENDLWALATSSGGLRGEMRLRLPPATALGLAQMFMSEPAAPDAALTSDHRDAVIELLRQVAGVVATGAKARWGELQLRIEAAAGAPSWSPAETLWLQAGAEGAARMVLEFGLSAALAAELRVEKIEAAPPAPDPPPAVSSADSGQPAGALDLVMDVRLALTMRFGARRLRLREVLELSPGAVVELDRRAQEPVELLLDGKLVARGEVVVIDGNYGLRVTDVSPLAHPISQEG